MKSKISNFNRYFPGCVLILAAGSFIGYMYYDILLYPNSFLLADTGDAIKNYFTYTAQSASGTWIQSPIMNYPYGEDFLYLDCHPLLTWIIHGWSIPFPEIQEYSVGILHILMMISLFLSALFVYLILRELRINPWWAVIGAFGIMVMSPQVFRMTGHLALSYALFIPLTWYLSIRFFRSRRLILWSLIIAGNGLFWFLIHAYLGMIAISFLAFQWLAEIYIFKNHTFTSKEKWIHAGIQVIAPICLFWGFVTMTDHHTGRTTNPWGFFANNANLETIFLPHHGILHSWLTSFINFKNQNWDGWAYIGLASTIVVIVLLIGLIQKKRKKSTGLTGLMDQITGQPILGKALGAAVILLLFAMAMPFNLGLQFLLEWFPVIKKFRGNGRFAWAFYYVMTVTSVYGLHYIYNHPNIFRFPGIIVKVGTVVLLMLYIVEGWPYHQDVVKQYGSYPNTFSTYSLPKEYRNGLNAIDPADYQAILPLPYYHKGSENFAIEGTDMIHRFSMTLAYHLCLPIWGSYATHTSIPESKKSIQTMSPDYYDKAIQADIPSKKDVLVVYSKENINRYEWDIMNKSEKIFSNDKYELYRLPVRRIFKSSAKDHIKDFNQKLQNGELFHHGEYYVSDSSGLIRHEVFEDSPSIHRISGEGAYHGFLSDRKPLWTVPAGSLRKDSSYILSFWFSNFGENYGQDITNVKVQVHEITKSGVRQIVMEVRPASSMVINGNWSLVEMEYTPHDNSHVIEVYLRGPWRGKGDYYIDELLLRKKGMDVYQVLQLKGDTITGIMENNQRILDSR